MECIIPLIFGAFFYVGFSFVISRLKSFDSNKEYDVTDS